MHNMIKLCPYLAAMVRSRALRLAEAREFRRFPHLRTDGNCQSSLHAARQRIKRVLTALEEKESQKTTITQRESDSKVSTTYANQSQKTEVSENRDAAQISETMKSVTYEISSQFSEIRVLPYC